MTHVNIRRFAGVALLLATTMLAACSGQETRTTTQEQAYAPAPAPMTTTTETHYRQ